MVITELFLPLLSDLGIPYNARLYKSLSPTMKAHLQTLFPAK